MIESDVLKNNIAEIIGECSHNPGSIEETMYEEITPTQHEVDETRVDETSILLTPHEQDAVDAPPQKGEMVTVKTFQTDLLGGDMTFKGILNSIVTFFTKVQAFLSPFEKQFESEAQGALTQIVGNILANTIATQGANLSSGAQIDVLVAETLKECETAAINVTKTAIINTLQAVYSHMYPEKTAVTFINAPMAVSAAVDAQAPVQ